MKNMLKLLQKESVEYNKNYFKDLILQMYWTLSFLRREGNTRKFPYYMYDISCIEELNKFFAIKNEI